MPLASALSGATAGWLITASVCLLLAVLGWRLIDFRRGRRYVTFSVDPAAPTDVDAAVLLRRHPALSAANLVAIELRNTGRVDVTGDDFESGIRFRFGRRTVVGVRVVESPTRSSVVGRLSVGLNEIRLPRLYLSRGDAVRVLVLLSGVEGSVDVDAQLTGGRFVSGQAGSVPHDTARMAIFWLGIAAPLGVVIGVLVVGPVLDRLAELLVVPGAVGVAGVAGLLVTRRRTGAGSPPVAGATVEMALYISGDDGVPIRRLFDGVLDLHGLMVVGADKPVVGSWFQRVRVRAKTLWGSDETKQRVREMEEALRQQVLEGPRTKLDRENAETIRSLIEAIRDQDEAMISTGAVYVVKVGDRLIADVLSPAELIEIRDRRDLRRSPKALYDHLCGRSAPELTESGGNDVANS